MAILQEEFSRVVFASSMDVFSDETMYRHYVKYYREASVTDQSEKGMVGQEGIIDSQNSTPKLLVNVSSKLTIFHKLHLLNRPWAGSYNRRTSIKSPLFVTTRWTT